jgi:hypothetical protein
MDRTTRRRSAPSGIVLLMAVVLLGALSPTSAVARGGGSVGPFTPQLVAACKATAQTNGRYFESEHAAYACSCNAEWSPTGGLSGLCVIKPARGATVTVRLASGSGSLNTAVATGILLVLGGPPPR